VIILKLLLHGEDCREEAAAPTLPVPHTALLVRHSLQVFRGDLDLAPVHMTSRALLQPWNLRVLNGPRLLSGVADRLRAYRVRDFRLQMHCAANHHRIVSPALVSLRKSSR
jgi:hypothetical protein